MPVNRKLALAWESDIALGVGERDLQADTTFGPIRDIIAKPTSIVADRQNEDIVQLSDILSLKNVEQFTVEDLDDLAYNSQILRGGGSPATSVVSLISSSPPTSNATFAINFPFSTDPDPQTGAVIFFASTQEVQYIAANANNFYDAVNRVYRLDIPVEAVTVGVVGRVGPNRIIRAQRAIGGFQRVTNFAPATGGSDAQSNTDLADELLIFNLGINDISTPYGIGLETKRQFPSITDYRVIFGSDTLLIRASVDAGATDIYLIASTSVSNSETFTYDGQPYVLQLQPVLSIVSVSSGPTNFIQGTHYRFLPDTTGPYGGSTKGQDALQFLPTSPLLPAIGDSITVTYNYNSFIGTIQNFFDSPKFRVDGRSLLYKQGQQLLAAVAGNLTVLPNFDPITVKNNVVAAILNFIGQAGGGSGLKLEQPLEQFDLLGEISQTVGAQGGVDNFVLTQLNLQGVSGVLAVVPATGAQYIRIESGDIAVSL